MLFILLQGEWQIGVQRDFAYVPLMARVFPWCSYTIGIHLQREVLISLSSFPSSSLCAFSEPSPDLFCCESLFLAAALSRVSSSFEIPCFLSIPMIATLILRVLRTSRLVLVNIFVVLLMLSRS